MEMQEDIWIQEVSLSTAIIEFVHRDSKNSK